MTVYQRKKQRIPPLFVISPFILRKDFSPFEGQCRALCMMPRLPQLKARLRLSSRFLFHLTHHNKIPSKRLTKSSRGIIVNVSGSNGANTAIAVFITMVLSNGNARMLRTTSKLPAKSFKD